MACGLVISSLLLVAGCNAPQTSQEDVISEIDRTVSITNAEISVFYPSADVIAEEKVVVQATDDLPLLAMRELFKAQPQDPDLKVTLPPADVRSVRIEDGVAWVDFDRAVLVSGEAAETQRTVLTAIIYTLKQFEGVEQVAFTVEGKTSGTLDGKDIEEFWGAVSLSDMPWSLTAKRTE
jgi:spore germination protein GerM